MDKGKTRRRKVADTLLRATIAHNVKNRAAVVFPDSKNVVVSIREASGSRIYPKLTRSTIQRIMEEMTSATLEQLAGLARALDLSPYQLLIPELDPERPQVAAAPRAHAREKEKA
jgi:transcriptional regulator with XRE-family HTH domain